MQPVTSEHDHGSVQTRELPQPGVGTLGADPGRDEGITSEKQVDHWSELDHAIRVTRRFGVAVLPSVLAVLSPGD
jgi:hypothetical protein